MYHKRYSKCIGKAQSVSLVIHHNIIYYNNLAYILCRFGNDTLLIHEEDDTRKVIQGRYT